MIGLGFTRIILQGLRQYPLHPAQNSPYVHIELLNGPAHLCARNQSSPRLQQKNKAIQLSVRPNSINAPKWRLLRRSQQTTASPPSTPPPPHCSLSFLRPQTLLIPSLLPPLTTRSGSPILASPSTSPLFTPLSPTFLQRNQMKKL